MESGLVWIAALRSIIIKTPPPTEERKVIRTISDHQARLQARPILGDVFHVHGSMHAPLLKKVKTFRVD